MHTHKHWHARIHARVMESQLNSQWDCLFQCSSCISVSQGLIQSSAKLQRARHPLVARVHSSFDSNTSAHSTQLSMYVGGCSVGGCMATFLQNGSLDQSGHEGPRLVCKKFKKQQHCAGCLQGHSHVENARSSGFAGLCA